MKIISVDTMRHLDERTIDAGTPGEALMERAGEGIVREMLPFLERRVGERHRRRFVVLAGKGNNGGDGYVVARLLCEQTEQPVSVYSVCSVHDLSGDARTNALRLPGGVAFEECEDLPPEALLPGTVLVDALLGTGIRGELRAPYDRLVGQVNASGLPVVAVDIPSGMNGDTGEAAGDAVVADLTVTMAQPKRGLLTPTGQARCGVLRCVDIGIPASFVEEAPGDGEAIFSRDVSSVLQRRPHDSHKGMFGHALVLGGSSRYVGAPVLVGEAALRVGTGLVTVGVPASVRDNIFLPLQALIVRGVPDGGDGVFHPAGGEVLASAADDADAVVFGPGVGRHPSVREVLEFLLGTDLPLLIDADGLRLLADLPPPSGRGAPLVVTPHPGEMRALLSGFGLERLVDSPRREQASELAQRHGLWVVLKGMGTVVAAPDGRTAINTSGDSGLASGGSGDVLSGLLGGLLAQGQEPWDALRLGVFLHGLAAELAVDSGRALVADDLLGRIGAAFRELTPFA